jgi:hypothetical protein
MMRYGLIATLFMLPLAVAQSPQTFRSRNDGVRLDVIVTDGGRSVPDLTSEDFEVLDNSVPQTIELQPTRRLGFTLALDVSYSVQDPGRLKYLIAAGQAATAAMLPGERASLVTFSDGARLVLKNEMRRPVDAALAAISGSIAKRKHDFGTGILAGTAGWDALLASVSLAVTSADRPVVVWLTDVGDNQSWLLTEEPIDAEWNRRAKATYFETLRDAGAVVEVIWLPRFFCEDGSFDNIVGPSRHPEDAAKATGGVAIPAESSNVARDLAAHFAKLRSGYVITYVPTGVSCDGSQHKVVVRLKPGKKGKIETRDQYVCAKRDGTP